MEADQIKRSSLWFYSRWMRFCRWLVRAPLCCRDNKIEVVLQSENVSCSRDWELLRSSLESSALINDQLIHQDLLVLMVSKFVHLEKQVDTLLSNILPPVVADEIKYLGSFAPRQYDCTILFIDVVGFTRLAERHNSDDLVTIIDAIFCCFDRVTRAYNGTKIKTIGDSYMVVFGAPLNSEVHADEAVRAGLAMLADLAEFNYQRFGGARDDYFQCRIGIHSGMVTAGVVGEDRMQFDVFGDTVNVASRFESAGLAGRINISEETRRRLSANFICEDRGDVHLKNKGNMRAYFVKEIDYVEDTAV